MYYGTIVYDISYCISYMYHILTIDDYGHCISTKGFLCD